MNQCQPQAVSSVEGNYGAMGGWAQGLETLGGEVQHV